MHKVGKVLVGIVVFPLMGIYVLAVLYLTFRKDAAVTFDEPEHGKHIENQMEKGRTSSGSQRVLSSNQIPFREDLAYIPFPE